MASKYQKQMEHYLQIVNNHTDLNLRISNDGDRHFLIDDKGHTLGHSETFSNLYSSVFLLAEFIGAHKIEVLKNRYNKGGDQ